MRILVAADKDILADYLRNAGHETKSLYVNDMAVEVSRKYGAEVVVYLSTVTEIEPHKNVVKALKDDGYRVVLGAGNNDPLIAYAAALGVTDIILSPLDPADVLYRLNNPATLAEVAALVWRHTSQMNGTTQNTTDALGFRREQERKGSGDSGGENEKIGKAVAGAGISEKDSLKKKLSGFIGNMFRSRDEEKEEAPAGIIIEVKIGEVMDKLLNPGSLGYVPAGIVKSAIENERLSSEIEKRSPDDRGINREKGLIEKLIGISKALRISKRQNKKQYHSEDDKTKNIKINELPEGIRTKNNFSDQMTALQAEPMKEEGTAQNVGEQKAYGTDRVIEESNKDELTGCYTRRFLQDYHPLASYVVVFIDLDRFKPVNDILGHEAGDRVLATFGRMLCANLKGRDLAIRWGGDEFVLILPDTSEKAAGKVLENLRAEWEKTSLDIGNLKVGFSAGIAVGQDSNNLPEVIKAADREMYKIKHAGRIPDAGRHVETVLPTVTQPTTNYSPMYNLNNIQRENPAQVIGQVLKGLFSVMGVLVILSLGVWTVNFSLSIILGIRNPFLNTTATLVEEFWKMLFTGVFG